MHELRSNQEMAALKMVEPQQAPRLRRQKGRRVQTVNLPARLVGHHY
jgi:hypothetical protein